MAMSNLLKRMVLMASMLGIILLAMPGTSSAEDVWCYSSNGFSYYLSSDTVKVKNAHPPYRGYVKIVNENDGKLWNFFICGFANENDMVDGDTLSRGTGDWGTGERISKNPLYYAVWQAMKPYL